MIAEKGSGYELESSSSRQCGRRALKWRRLLGVAGLTPTKYDIEVPCQSILSGGSPLSYYSDDDENWATVVSDTICSSRKRYWELRRQHAPHVLEVVAATSEGKQENFENEEELPLNLTTAAKSLSQLCDNSETVSSHWDGDPLTAEEGTDWHNWHDSMKIVQETPSGRMGRSISDTSSAGKHAKSTSYMGTVTICCDSYEKNDYLTYDVHLCGDWITAWLGGVIRAHPNISYCQGMHEILATIYWVLENEERQIPCPLYCTEGNWKEPDAYLLFEIILAAIEPIYAHGEAETCTIVDICEHVQGTRLSSVDSELSEKLRIAGIAPQLYGVRWMRLLFCREVETIVGHCILWDQLFSLAACGDLLDAIECTAIALLTLKRESLLSADSNEYMSILMKESEIRLLMAIACSIVATGKISLYPCNSKSSVSKGLVSPCLHSFDMMDDRGSTNGNESNAPMVFNLGGEIAGTKIHIPEMSLYDMKDESTSKEKETIMVDLKKELNQFSSRIEKAVVMLHETALPADWNKAVAELRTISVDIRRFAKDSGQYTEKNNDNKVTTQHQPQKKNVHITDLHL